LDLKPLLVVVPLLCGCSGEDEVDAESRALLQQVPIGTPFQELPQAMQRLGYSCVEDVRRYVDRSGTTRDGATHLSCQREERSWLVCARRTRVELLQFNGRFSNALVNVGRFC
jgi:hypothetical protein